MKSKWKTRQEELSKEFNENTKKHIWGKVIYLKGKLKVFEECKALRDADLDDFEKKLKVEWRAKCRRMNIMSGEVAIFELEGLIQKTRKEIDK